MADQFVEFIENGSCLMARMAEDLWNTYPPERQMDFQAKWLARATGMDGIGVVALQLIPDELFPTGTNEKPYIAWQDRLPGRDVPTGYVLDIRVTVTLDAIRKTVPVVLRNSISQELRDKLPVGTPYVIIDASGDRIVGGKV